MTLRIGGIAAILGAGLLVAAAVSTMNVATERFATALAVAGMFALLVALVGVSAFQARTRPRLVWTAFGLCAFGTITNLVGVLGLMGLADLSGPWEAWPAPSFVVGVVAGLVGFSLFGIATCGPGSCRGSGPSCWPSRRSCGSPPFVMSHSATGDSAGGWSSAASLAFLLGWLIIGIAAIRLDQPANDARPALTTGDAIRCYPAPRRAMRPPSRGSSQGLLTGVRLDVYSV